MTLALGCSGLLGVGCGGLSLPPAPALGRECISRHSDLLGLGWLDFTGFKAPCVRAYVRTCVSAYVPWCAPCTRSLLRKTGLQGQSPSGEAISLNEWGY